MDPARPTRRSNSSAIGSLLSLYPIGVVLLTFTTTVPGDHCILIATIAISG